MSSPPILGPVAFESFEVPERISFGGRQKLVIHAMPGGRRVVDTMGPEDAPVKWSGVFSGRNAGSRVHMLERLRRLGGRLLLTWDSWRFSVIIQAFEAEVASPAWIPYRIELCVVPGTDETISDWLATAASPILTTAVITGAALQSAIGSAEAEVANASIFNAVAASGALAQYVTMRAYAGEQD